MSYAEHFQRHLILFLPLNMLVVMFPSVPICAQRLLMGFLVTSFQIFKKSRDTFSAPMEHSGPLLCPCLLCPGLSQTPPTWHASLALLQCLRKPRSPLTQGCRPLCQPLPSHPHWEGTQPFPAELVAFFPTPCFSWSAPPSTWWPTAETQSLSTFIHLAPTLC